VRCATGGRRRAARARRRPALVESNAGVADGVRQALGREPRAFADYARDAAATGIWDARAAA
jgi:hypothetical protein